MIHNFKIFRIVYLFYFTLKYSLKNLNNSHLIEILKLFLVHSPIFLVKKWLSFGAKNNILSYNDYNFWIEEIEKRKDTLDKKEVIHRNPLISIVLPVYNTPIDYLKQAIDSVFKQSYSNWELCIADDNSSRVEVIDYLKSLASNFKIKIIFREQNGNISEASNDALSLATGEYVAFLDHDDMLHENALLSMVKSINDYPEAIIFYSDEDKINSKNIRFQPHFKSDWNYELFLGYNYICHFVVIRRNNIEFVKGFRKGYEGAQDYDLLLRIIENIHSSQIIHIPRILYHWRMIPGSTALNLSEKDNIKEITELVLNEHFARKKIDGTFLYQDKLKIFKPKYYLKKQDILVSIVIPTRNSKKLVENCISSILESTVYTNYEIILIDNQSNDTDSLDLFEKLSYNPNIKVIKYDKEFNFSSINNFAVSHSKGEYLVLLNNDTEVMNRNWLSDLLSIATQKDVGAVGVKLLYPNKKIQHGGILIGRGGVAGHLFQFLDVYSPGYFNRAQMLQTVSAVTAACLMVSRENYMRVNGMNEENLAVAFNDVDFCLKLNKIGLRNIWTPDVTLYHYESISRGKENNPIKRARFKKEIDYMKNTWSTSTTIDQYYNKNLNLHRGDFTLNWINY